MSDLNEQLRECAHCGSEARFTDTNAARCLNEECNAEIWTLHKGTTARRWNRRAPAAAPAPVAAITDHDDLSLKVLHAIYHACQRGGSAEQLHAAIMPDVCAALAAVPAAAPIVQPVGDETAPLYDLSADKDFAEDFARLAEGIPHVKTRKLVIKAVKQAIAAHGAAERERGRREASAAIQAPVVQAEPVAWRDALRRSGANTDYHGHIAFTPVQWENFVSMLAASTTAAADAKDAAQGCRNEGGICACRSGGSFGGCAKERAAIATSADEVKRHAD